MRNRRSTILELANKVSVAALVSLMVSALTALGQQIVPRDPGEPAQGQR